jgi:hypothetical protein
MLQIFGYKVEDKLHWGEGVYGTTALECDIVLSAEVCVCL